MITKAGEIIIREDGIMITGFTLINIEYPSAQEEILAWGSDKLREAINEFHNSAETQAPVKGS